MGSYGIVCDGEDRVSPISWTIFHWEEVYYLFFLLDNQCLMCAILSLIHFQLIPYFKKKAIQSVFTLIAQTSYPEQTKNLFQIIFICRPWLSHSRSSPTFQFSSFTSRLEVQALTVTVRAGSRLPKSSKMLITAEMSTVAQNSSRDSP